MNPLLAVALAAQLSRQPLPASTTVATSLVVGDYSDWHHLERFSSSQSGSGAVRAGSGASAPSSSSAASVSSPSMSSGAATASGSATSTVRSDNKIGVYLSENSVQNTKFLDATMDELVKLHASSFVMVVKGSYVFFPSDAPLANDLGLVKPQYDIKTVVQKAHDKGLYVIARYISLKDALFAQKVPDAQIRNPISKISVGDVWVDGSLEPTQRYNREIITSLLQSGVDEINLDYIRFPTEYSYKSVGLLGREKADKVEAFVKMVRDTINAVRPQTKLGMSTYAIIGWNYDVNVEALGQDVVRFAPLVDVISPMAYPNSFAKNEYYYPGKNPRSRMYYLVYRTLTGYAKDLGPVQAKKLRPWIQGYFASPKDIRDEIDGVYDAGACGFQVWSAGNIYGNTYTAIAGLPKPPARCR